MGNVAISGSFQYPGAGNAFQVSDTLEADQSNNQSSLFVTVRFHGGGASVILESLPRTNSVETPSGIAGSVTANWTTVATYTSGGGDQSRTVVAIDRTKIYRLRSSVAGTAGTSVAYRLAMEDATTVLESLYVAAAAPGPFVG